MLTVFPALFPALARRSVLQKQTRRSARPVRLHRETDNRCFAGVWAYSSTRVWHVSVEPAPPTTWPLAPPDCAVY